MLREQNARLVPREEGRTKEGDLVTLDFKGYIEGEAFEGGEAENYSLELGSNSFIPGFEQQLVGVGLDEEVEVKVKFPEDYSQEQLAGKDASFKVRVKQIKEKQLPELDDEFVKEVSEFESLEDMKADLKEKLLKNAEEQSKSKLEESLIQKVTEVSTVEVPKILIDRQVDRMLGDLENYLRYQGMSLDQFVQLSGKTMDDLRADRLEEAEMRAKANLVLDAIAKKEGISIDDSELEAKIESIAESYNDEAERIKDLLEKQGRLPVIREELRVRKVIDLLIAEAKIKKVKKKKPAKPKAAAAKKVTKKKASTPEKTAKKPSKTPAKKKKEVAEEKTEE
jgi:trigger factor